jgi:hypothetical protein
LLSLRRISPVRGGHARPRSGVVLTLRGRGAAVTSTSPLRTTWHADTLRPFALSVRRVSSRQVSLSPESLYPQKAAGVLSVLAAIHRANPRSAARWPIGTRRRTASRLSQDDGEQNCKALAGRSGGVRWGRIPLSLREAARSTPWVVCAPLCPESGPTTDHAGHPGEAVMIDGWRCPVCGDGKAPWMASCPHPVTTTSRTVELNEARDWFCFCIGSASRPGTDGRCRNCGGKTMSSSFTVSE